MTKNNLVMEQAKILEDLETTLGKTLPHVKGFGLNPFGIKIENGYISGLGLARQELSILPEPITKLKSLKELYLGENQLSNLPESIGDLKSLQDLSIHKNQLENLPESIGNLSSLQKLILSTNKLTTLPNSIGNLSSLKDLFMPNNKFTTLPESITRLTSLERLYLSNNQLLNLPESIGNLSSLKTINLDNNRLSSLPESIGNLKSLQDLNIEKNQLENLPESIGKLSSLNSIYLENNKLSTFPDSIGNIKSLEYIYSSNNEITSLPESIGNLPSLKTLKLKMNQLTTLPEFFWHLKALKTIDLADNPWKGAWKGIEVYDPQAILERSRHMAPIIVFITYSKDDEKQYRLSELKVKLENQVEINEVHWSELHDISESQLFLFIATKNSLNDKKCQKELELALTCDIPIIPIKGTDITFENLNQIDLGEDFNLSEKLGLSFDGENVEMFSDELYAFIKKYKREVNLFELEERKFNKQWETIIIQAKKFITSEEFKEKFQLHVKEFLKLSQAFRSKQISTIEYLFKCAQILDSEE